MDTPSPDDVRQTLAHFDGRHQKIVSGMVGVMMQSPTQVRDREWVAEQLTHLTLMAGDFEADSADGGVKVVQEFLQNHASELLNASFLLFHRVALDLEPKASEGFSFDEAMKRVLDYLPAVEAEEAS